MQYPLKASIGAQVNPTNNDENKEGYDKANTCVQALLKQQHIEGISSVEFKIFSTLFDLFGLCNNQSGCCYFGRSNSFSSHNNCMFLSDGY